MGACPNGALPNPSAAGLQVWIDRAKLPLDVAGMLPRLSPLAWAALAAQLVDVDRLCAENPDVPEPFTSTDFQDQTPWGLPQLAIAKPAVIEKAYKWLRYGEFLLNCQCAAPLPPTGGACPYNGASWSLAPAGATAPVPYDIPQSSYDAWQTAGVGPTADWRPTNQMSWTGHSVSTTQHFLEWSSDGSTWRIFEEIPNSSSGTQACASSGSFIPAPRMPRTGLVRARNNSAVTFAISSFNYCFCATQAVIPPVPPQPPLTVIPTPPATVCSTDDLCLMVHELANQLYRIAAQVSDLQAGLLSRETLTVLSSQPISGEGEATLALGTHAVSVELSTLGPEAFTSALGRPRGLMRVGSIRYGDGVGYSPRKFIDADRFDDVVPHNALSLSWQLLAGTAGTLKFLG